MDVLPYLYISVNSLASQSLLQNSSQHSSASQALSNHLEEKLSGITMDV